jgi:hypothetical protein
MDREPRKSVAPCCLHRGFFFIILSFLLGRGSQESGVKQSFNISLQEHIHSPMKASCLLACGILRHPQGAMTCEATCPLQDVGITVLSWGWGTGSLLASDPPDPTSPLSGVSTQLLLGKGAIIHLATSC